MNTSKEIRPKGFVYDPLFGYLPDQDRYLSAYPAPRYRLNLIGVGNNGQEHLRLTLLEGRATVKGIYDPNPRSVLQAQETFSRFQAQKGAETTELVAYDSLAAACNDPEVDGLIIATPNYTHLNVLRTAVAAGKHILLEKPMATTVADAREIVRLARGYPAVLQIGMQYRYKATYAEAIHEVLERGAIGEVKTISILEHRMPFLDKVNQWNKFSKFSGGTLVEKCCHYFDLMNLFARSRPVQVYASGSMAVNFVDFEYGGEKSDILDNAFVVVDYANGVRGNFNLCMFAPMFYEEMVICGDEGRLKAYENEDFLSVPRPRMGLEILCGESKPARLTSPAYPAYIETSGHNGASFYEHINFLDNIAGKNTNTASVEDGFWAVVIGAAAEESVKSRQPVRIRELLERDGVVPEG